MIAYEHAGVLCSVQIDLANYSRYTVMHNVERHILFQHGDCVCCSGHCTTPRSQAPQLIHRLVPLLPSTTRSNCTTSCTALVGMWGLNTRHHGVQGPRLYARYACPQCTPVTTQCKCYRTALDIWGLTRTYIHTHTHRSFS